MYLGSFGIDDYVGIPAATHRFTTGGVYAPSVLTYSIYEEATDGGIDENVDMVPGTPFDAVVGCYWIRRQLTTAAGFESGKNYMVLVKATVDSVSAIQMHTFQVEAKVRASLTHIMGTALAGTAAQIAAAFTKFFDKAAPTGTINSLPDAVAGATNGLFIAGTNAATTVTTAFTTTFTGNLTGTTAKSPATLATGDVTGNLPANVCAFLGTAITETAGLIAAAFTKFFNKATPTGTINSLPDAVAGANNGLPTTNGTKLNQTVDLTAGQSIAASSVPAVTLANGAHGGAATVITLQTPIAATVPNTQKVDVETIKTQAVTCAAGVTVLASVGAPAAPGANGGLPTTNGTKINQTVDLTSGQTIAANLTQIIGTALTETVPGYIALAFKKFFDVLNATLTCLGVNQSGNTFPLVNDVIAEMPQGIPPATPTPREAQMYFYMALRNQMVLDAVANEKKIYNNAGVCITKKALADVAGIYTESEAVSGP